MKKKTRNSIQKQIDKKLNRIKQLLSETKQLQIEQIQISSKEQWYKEETEQVTISKRPKKIVSMLIGRIYWTQDFVDEDTGEVVSIERSRIVREGDYWTLNSTLELVERTRVSRERVHNV